jgi:bifunctional DNA-binding transcriptional regulator/antitoxin component of YhaV-PrlF toxin-antitoxin module
MPDQDTSEARVIEPLAKFHAETDTQGRFYLPKATAKRFGININDYVDLIVRVINQKGEVSHRIHILARVSSNRLIHLPKGFYTQAGGPKMLIEVILIRWYTADDLLSPTGKQLISLFKNKYQLLSAEDEQKLFQELIQR